MNLRYLWRSVSLVFVLWFALFPTLSYASETVIDETYTYDWREAERELLDYSNDITSGSSSTWSIKDSEISSGYLDAKVNLASVKDSVFSFALMNANMGSYTPPYNFSTGTYANSTMNSIWNKPADFLQLEFHFVDSTGDTIVDKGDIIDINVSGLFAAYHNSYSWSIVNFGGGTGSYAEPFDTSQFRELILAFVDGSSAKYVTLSTDNITRDGDTFGISAKGVEVPMDSTEIRFVFRFNASADDLDSSKTHNGFSGWANSGVYEVRFVDSTLSIEIEDATTGLLSGIIDWLRSIRDGIVNVGTGVTNVFNSILELPSRIWTFIQEGLKMLFIPSEQDISNMHNQWDELMRDRFGAIYESGDIVHSFADTMNVNSAMVADTGGVITMPSVTANLAGTNFTFGGYEVDLVPDGFQWLVTSIKMLINIVCTILFINALKGKIEVLLR